MITANTRRLRIAFAPTGPPDRFTLAPMRPIAPITFDYSDFVGDIKTRIASARLTAARAVNSELVGLYWDIGAAKRRANYGDVLIKRLAIDLTAQFDRGFGWRNLFQMHAFYLAWPDILQTASAISIITAQENQKLQAAPAISETALTAAPSLAAIASRFAWQSTCRRSAIDFCTSAPRTDRTGMRCASTLRRWPAPLGAWAASAWRAPPSCSTSSTTPSTCPAAAAPPTGRPRLTHFPGPARCTARRLPRRGMQAHNPLGRSSGTLGAYSYVVWSPVTPPPATAGIVLSTRRTQTPAPLPGTSRTRGARLYGCCRATRTKQAQAPQ